LDEADAMALLQGLAQLVRTGLASRPETTREQWVANLAQRGRHVAKVVAAFRERGPADAKKLAQTHGLRWPTDTNHLVEQLLRGAEHG
jgi:hypothetical protein